MMAALSPLRLITLAAFALPLLPATAFGAAATTSQGTSMRSGPAASYGVVAQLARGDSVDVRQCEGTFCEVLFNGKSGWVSAIYLTRNAVPHPPAGPTSGVPQVATVAPPKPVPVQPPVPSSAPKVAVISPKAMPVPAPKIVAPVEPQIAAIPAPEVAPTPSAKHVPSLPKGKIAVAPKPEIEPSPPKPKPSVAPPPPAYAEAGPKPMAQDPGAVTPEVTPMPGPRPKVDIPGGPDRNYAYNDAAPSDGDFAADEDAPDVIGPVPEDGGNRRMGRDFADVGPMIGRRACFIDQSSGSGFCVREGDQIVAPRRWATRTLALRNPQRLNVIVCAADSSHCHRYLASSPLVLGGRGIASITVAAPGY
jgi:uncharacterized protein YraI